MLNIGDVLDNRYDIQSKIGQGGMSYVYRAKDTKLGREVAIKVLKEEYSSDEEFVERFKNEARAAARLSHPNIVAAYDIVDSGDIHYIVMELVEGITLKNYIAKKKILSNKETIGIALQAAEGISEAHKNNIIHRDIKPQNIIISKDGKIKVADFGIAKAVTGETLNSQAVIGSAHYIAPEQAKSGQTDMRSDLYSLGISMYEMITGKVPYDGDNTVNIVLAHIQNAMVPPSVYNHDIFPALNDIIIKATKKAPEERYQTAEELIEDLRHAVSEPDGHFVKLYDSVSSSEAGVENKAQTESSVTENAGVSASDRSSGESGRISARTGGDEAGGGEDRTSGNTDTSGSDASASGMPDGGSGASDGKKRSAEEEKKIKRIGIIGLIIFLFLLMVFALIMLKKAGDRKEELASQEAMMLEAAAEMSEAETETEMDYTISIKGEDLMPDLLGMDVDAARARLSDLQMSMDSSAEEYSETFRKGLIIKQNPASGQILTSGTTVYVTVSKGSVLDDLMNKTPEEAADMLETAGYTVENGYGNDFSDSVAEGLVSDYQLIGENGEVLDKAAARRLIEAGNRLNRPALPAGSEAESGEEQSTASAGGSVSHGQASGAGTDINQNEDHTGSVSSGTYRMPGVRLILSRGKISDYAMVPDLAGITVSEARMQLEQNGFVLGKATALNTSEYVSGQIAGQSVASGEYAKKGTAIDISLSVGNSGTVADGTEMDLDSEYPDGSGKTDTGLSDDYFYGNIDTTCTVGKAQGPGGTDQIMVGVRLRQRVDGSDEYTQIASAIPVASGTRIPVSFKNIRGAYGVESGYVEVFNSETQEIYATFSISFSALDDEY